MKITKIEQQQKTPERYNLYLDHQFWLGVDEGTLIRFMLFKDKEVTVAEKLAVEEGERIQKAYNRAVAYLGAGIKSVKEVEIYLTRYFHREWQANLTLESQEPGGEEANVKPLANHGQWNNLTEVLAPPSSTPEGSQDRSIESISTAIQTIIDKLLQQGYLDDQAYAEAYVRTMATVQYKGPKQIRAGLREKGIPEDFIRRAMLHYNQDQQMNNLMILAEKYSRQLGKISRKRGQQKLRAYLINKGFSLDQVSQLETDHFLQGDENREWDNLQREADKQLRNKSTRFKGKELRHKLFQALYQKGFEADLIHQWLGDHTAELSEEDE